MGLSFASLRAREAARVHAVRSDRSQDVWRLLQTSKPLLTQAALMSTWLMKGDLIVLLKLFITFIC